MGQATAQLNLSELSRQLGYPEDHAAAAVGGADAPLANVNGNKQQLGGGGAAVVVCAWNSSYMIKTISVSKLFKIIRNLKLE